MPCRQTEVPTGAKDTREKSVELVTTLLSYIRDRFNDVVPRKRRPFHTGPLAFRIALKCETTCIDVAFVKSKTENVAIAGIPIDFSSSQITRHEFLEW